MDDYDVTKGVTAIHEFIGAESFDEVLAAIAKWWAGIGGEKNIFAITFTLDEDGLIDADVLWHYLTKQEVEELEHILTRERPLPPIEQEAISEN